MAYLDQARSDSTGFQEGKNVTFVSGIKGIWGVGFQRPPPTSVIRPLKDVRAKIF